MIRIANRIIDYACDTERAARDSAEGLNLHRYVGNVPTYEVDVMPPSHGLP